MVMPYNYRSLIDHVGSGKDWDLDRKNGGLFVLPGKRLWHFSHRRPLSAA